MPTDPERLPVWTALSELYLDTEIQEADIRRIAAILNRSPYNRQDLNAILQNEVAPAFSANLMSVAGEWTPWSENEVQVIVESWLEKKSGSLFMLLAANLHPKIIPDEWAQINALLK